MKELQAFQQFGRGKDPNFDPGNRRTVIYSRVSTKDQEDNTSLANQYETCMKLVEREELEVIAEFGGKGESAKQGSARKEYERMLKFVKSKSNRVRFVVFYSYDRFSREGGKAIVTKQQLKSLGILVKSATMPIDTSNPYGEGMEDMQLIFAKIENDVRRNRTIDGMRSKLRQGNWCGTAPFGYKWDNGKLVPDSAKAQLVKKAFQDKLDNPELTPRAVRQQWAKKGIRVCKNTVGRMWRNPIYCGLISHTLLEGEVVVGKHPSLISQDDFLEVNQVFNKQYAKGWKFNQDNYDYLPLKVFMKCECCGKPLTGYVSTRRNGKPRKNPLPFYKCRTNGCLTNISAHKLNTTFAEVLKLFKVEENQAPIILKLLKAYLAQSFEDKLQEEIALQERMEKAQAKLDRLRERYILEEEISKDDYEFFRAKLQKELIEIEGELRQARQISSTLLDDLDQKVDYLTKIDEIWEDGPYSVKTQIQNMVFPEGISYDKQNHTVRPHRVNEVIGLSKRFEEVLWENGGREEGELVEVVHRGSREGTDPARGCAQTHSLKNTRPINSLGMRKQDLFFYFCERKR